MEQKKKEQKTAQILYITMIMVLLIMAIAVGLVTAAGKRNRPSESSADSSAAITSDTLPDKDHTAPSVTTTVSSAASSSSVTTTTAGTTKPVTTTTPKPVAAVETPVSTLPEFIMPTMGNISRTFSADVLVWSNTMEDYRTHNGIDICSSLGESVMAAADGIVTEVYAHPMMGNTVVIAHDGNAETVYQNLADDMLVSVGDTVKAGEVIGAVGESAIIEIAEDPHLHFEMQVDGVRVDPVDYIAAATMTILYEDE